MRVLHTIAICAAVVAIGPAVQADGLERLEISPSAVMNLSGDYSGHLMGGAVTLDAFFNEHFAIRGTFGYTKQRYYPDGLPYSEADRGIWLSLAPYFEMSTGSFLRPYVAVVGTFTSSAGRFYPTSAPAGMELAPYARVSQASRASSFQSLGATLGSKVHLAGRVSLHAEVSHYIYTSISDPTEVYSTELGPLGEKYDFRENPTYLSIGFSYSIPLGQSK